MGSLSGTFVPFGQAWCSGFSVAEEQEVVENLQVGWIATRPSTLIKKPPRLILSTTNADMLATLFPSSGSAHGDSYCLVLGMGPFNRHFWLIGDLEDLVTIAKEMVEAGMLDLLAHRRAPPWLRHA